MRVGDFSAYRGDDWRGFWQYITYIPEEMVGRLAAWLAERKTWRDLWFEQSMVIADGGYGRCKRVVFFLSWWRIDVGR